MIELCFQTAGIVEIAQTGTLALPRSVANLRVSAGEGSGPGMAVVRPAAAPGCFDVEVIDAGGAVLLTLTGYGTVAIPSAVEPARQRAMQSAIA